MIQMITFSIVVVVVIITISVVIFLKPWKKKIRYTEAERPYGWYPDDHE